MSFIQAKKSQPCHMRGAQGNCCCVNVLGTSVIIRSSVAAEKRHLPRKTFLWEFLATTAVELFRAVPVRKPVTRRGRLLPLTGVRGSDVQARRSISERNRLRTFRRARQATHAD